MVFPQTFLQPPSLARGGGLTWGLFSSHFSHRELKAWRGVKAQQRLGVSQPPEQKGQARPRGGKPQCSQALCLSVSLCGCV